MTPTKEGATGQAGDQKEGATRQAGDANIGGDDGVDRQLKEEAARQAGDSYIGECNETGMRPKGGGKAQADEAET